MLLHNSLLETLLNTYPKTDTNDTQKEDQGIVQGTSGR